MADGNDFNAHIIDEFRANEGRVGGNFEGAPLLLLHSTGAKSGKERVSPMMYQAVGGDYAVFASKAGAPDNPAWFHNLVANPDTVVHVRGQRNRAVRARVAGPEERAALWPRLVELYADFEKYAAWTDREIPVVILEPR